MGDPGVVKIELVDSDHDGPLAAILIAEIQHELTLRYGGPDETPVQPGQFAPPSGAFLVAIVDGTPVGCVALRRVSDTDVELKRMYVRNEHRRRGLAGMILAAAEQRAADAGYRRVLLETGLQQPEAMALYEANGYEPIVGFGHYCDQDTSRAYAKLLAG